MAETSSAPSPWDAQQLARGGVGEDDAAAGQVVRRRRRDHQHRVGQGLQRCLLRAWRPPGPARPAAHRSPGRWSRRTRRTGSPARAAASRAHGRAGARRRRETRATANGTGAWATRANPSLCGRSTTVSSCLMRDAAPQHGSDLPGLRTCRSAVRKSGSDRTTIRYRTASGLGITAPAGSEAVR